MLEQKIDYLNIPTGVYGKVSVTNGWYQCSGLDGIDANIRLSGNSLLAVDAGDMADLDESELMGQAPRYVDVTNKEYTGDLVAQLPDGGTLTFTVANNVVTHVK